MADFSIELEWKNLNLEISKTKINYWKCKKTTEHKTILNNVSGNLKSGQLIAILGSSGAGKTTLLASISQRFRGPLTGHLSINGVPIDRKTMTKISCFVPQFDITLDCLTPNEHMYFMGELKLDRKWSRSRKNRRIDFLMQNLGLQGVGDNRISTLSGGERKKLNLATDLLSNPPIIFCDEPTTGLDSFNARNVVKALKHLVESHADDSLGTDFTSENGTSVQSNGIELLLKRQKSKSASKAIICSIHQPTSEVFQCFSHIILMRAGKSVFQGTATEAFHYFSRLGFHCPVAYNPADFFINVLSHNKIDSKNLLKTDHPKSITSSDNQDLSFDQISNQRHLTIQIHKTIWIKQVWILMQRSFLQSKRNLKNIFFKFICYLIPYVAMGVLYQNITGNTQESIQDIQGIFFMLTCEIVFTTLYRILNFYLSKIPLLRRETHERIYCLSAYYIAECLTDGPFLMVKPLIGLVVTYLLSSFNKGFLFFLEMWLTMSFLAFASNAYGLMLAGLFRWVILEVPPVFNLFFTAMSGIYANLREYPILKFTSLFFYGNEALSIFYWHDVATIECDNDSCLRNGTEVLDNFAYNTNLIDVLWDFVGLTLLGVGMHLLAFFGIRRTIQSAGYY